MLKKILYGLFGTMILVPMVSMADGLILVKFDSGLPTRTARIIPEPRNMPLMKAAAISNSLTLDTKKAVLVGQIIRSKNFQLPDVIQVNSEKDPGAEFSELKNPLSLSFLVEDETYTCAAEMDISFYSSDYKVKSAVIVCPKVIKQLLGFERIEVKDFNIK